MNMDMDFDDGSEFDFDLPAMSGDDSDFLDFDEGDQIEDLHLPPIFMQNGDTPIPPCNSPVSPCNRSAYTPDNVSMPLQTDVYMATQVMRFNYAAVSELVSSYATFAELSWGRVKNQYERVGCPEWGRRRNFDYHSYRILNDTCRFYVVDNTNDSNTREFARRVVRQAGFQRGNYGKRDGNYVKRDDNHDHHMIPLLCCDRSKRSLLWMPIDINCRPHNGSGCVGQPIFADFMEPNQYNIRLHPTWQYRSFLHGIDHHTIDKPLRGYYPLRSDLAACPDPTARARMWREREPLSLIDGFEILKKLASADPNSWSHVMAFMPFNEKCSWAQYLSSDTCERVYGVHYPIATTRPQLKQNIRRSIFTGATIGGLQPLSARMQEVASIKRARYHARTTKPFDQLWHLKTTYDLSNFCNRHNARSVALFAITTTINDTLVPTIEDICRRMTDLCVTRVQIDGSKEQAHIAARHAVDHNNYMQAWRDLSTLTALAMFDEEPPQAEVNRCFAMWRRHSRICRGAGVTPQFNVPFLHTQWHVKRLHSFVAILYRYMGKNFNDMLSFVYETDCALRDDITREASKGRTTTLDLLSAQISTAFDLDMKNLFGQCVRYNYQEMDCTTCTRTDNQPLSCPIGGDCFGCDCHPAAKKDTADHVERMFAHLDKYQSTFNLDYGSETNFPPTSYTSSTLQYAHHQHRKRFAVAGTTSMVNKDLTTIPGIESLLNLDNTRSKAPPMFYNPLSRERYL
jgi:hypothetical protein